MGMFPSSQLCKMVAKLVIMWTKHGAQEMAARLKNEIRRYVSFLLLLQQSATNLATYNDTKFLPYSSVGRKSSLDLIRLKSSVSRAVFPAGGSKG